MKLVRTLMIFCGLAATIRTQIVTIESVDTSENCSLFGSASITGKFTSLNLPNPTKLSSILFLSKSFS